MKPILFLDFDGTICHDKYWRSLPPAQYAQVQELIFGNDRSRLTDWMIGKYTAEEINQYVADCIGIPYDEFWKIFVRDCTTMQVSEDTLKKISSLRDTYTTILITGNMDSFTRFTVPALKLDTYFDHINNSFFEGKHKSDEQGAVFTSYADALRTPIQNCILIDDSLKNCETFTRLGGIAYQITPEKNIDQYLNLLG